MATFTTWAALKQQILNDMASQALTTGEYRTPGGQMVRYRSLKELRELLGWVTEQADAEAATSGTAYRRAQAVSRGPC